MNLSGKTLTFATNQISGNAIDGGVISNFASTGIDDNASSTALTITSGGNVGIGIVDPTADLQLGGSNPNLVFGTTGNELTYLQRYNDDFYIYNKETSGKLFLGTNNQTQLTVNATGNVGIGETNPLDSLSISSSAGNAAIRLKRTDTTILNDDIYGTINFAGDDADTNASGIRGFIRGKAQGTGGGMKMEFHTAGGGVALVSDPRMTLNADGNLGIGTDAPTDKLTVSGGHINLPTVNSYIKGNGHNVLQVDATRTYFYGGTNGMQFRTSDNSAELVNILDNGLLGLYRATADPTATAAGQMYFNTTSGAVKVYDGSAWDQIQALTPFSTINTRYQPHTQVNTQNAGSAKITSYGAPAWSNFDGGSAGGNYFGGHDGHGGSPNDYPAYVAVYLGGRHAVNRLNLVLHGNHFGYFQLQGSNNSGTGGSYDAGSWTSLPFVTSNGSQSNQNAGGQSSGLGDGTVLTYQYNNDIAYSSYRLWIKDSSQPSESLGTRYTGWATYYWELYRD
jgi:hypothetical protein